MVLLSVHFQTGKAALGEMIYWYITSEQFSPECLLDYMDLSSEHRALEVANRVEAFIFVWRRRENAPPRQSANKWGGMVRDLISDAERRELLADRAESFLICLKQRFPCLTQTTLDTTKIQCNKVSLSLPHLYLQSTKPYTDLPLSLTHTQLLDIHYLSLSFCLLSLYILSLLFLSSIRPSAPIFNNRSVGCLSIYLFICSLH